MLSHVIINNMQVYLTYHNAMPLWLNQ